MRLAAKQLSIFLLCAVFLLCLYRAATQSFTIDESFTFLHYVNVSFSQAISEYSANNHVLQSLLMRVFRRLLGRSELVMRLPTLIGCVLYLTAIYGITAASIRNGWLRLLALAVMTLNPLVLDLLVAARGYALALGLSWWALYLAWSDLLEPKPRRLWLAGVCAGLAVTANLIFVIPLAAFGLMLVPLYARRGRFWHLIDSYAGPAIIICFVLLFIPLLKSAGQFYFGVATLRDTFGSLFGESLRQPPAGSFVFNNLDRLIPDLSAHLAAVAAPLVIACMGVAAVWLLVLSIRGANAQTVLLALVLGCIASSVGCWIVLNRMFAVVYPMTRTALYFLPLAGFAIVLSASVLKWRIVSGALALVAAVLAVIYVGEIRTGYFSEWKHEAGMKRLMRQLAYDARELHKVRPVTAGGSWDLEYSVRYYGIRYRLGWLNVLNSEERKSIQPDYYVLGPVDTKLVNELQLTVIAKDELSGTVLARRS
jgi:hypothetical protein